MKLIKNQNDFENFKLVHVGCDDFCEPPIEYPCYIYSEVRNWNHQTLTFKNVYITDIEVMLENLKQFGES